MANLKDTLVFGKLTATGTITANKFKGPLEGNADTATKFSAAKTIALSGDVSGTGSSDGGSQWDIVTTVADDSHNHKSENISDLSTTLTTWLNSAKSYTDTAVAGVVDSAPDVLNTLKELSAALNNDKDYYVTINNALAGKVAKAGDEMSGSLIFSTNDAIKYKNGSTRTGVPIRFYGGDANGSAVVIGDGGLTLIGGGESAANLRTALVDTNKTKTNASEELYLTSDGAIYLYTNYQTASSAKITTYDSSGNWTMPGTVTATQFTGPSKALYSSGFGNGTLTYLQTSSDFNGNSGWAHYLIANHGDGEIYYNYTIALPFWGAPKYRRKTGYSSGGATADRATNAAASLSEWYEFLTQENYATTLDNVYLQLTGGTLSGGLTVSGTTTLNSTLTVAGATTLSGNLTVNGSSTLKQTVVNDLLTISRGNKKGIRLGGAYITAESATNGEVVLQGGHLRFGATTDDWDYNLWGGLGYAKATKTIALGLADNSFFAANAVQTGGTVTMPGIHYLVLSGKEAIAAYDTWLRINEDAAFSSGIYCGSNIVRTDGQFQVGSGGSAFYATSAGNAYASVSVSSKRIYAGYDAGADNSISCSNWFRVNGETGLYNATYDLHVMPNTVSDYCGWRIRGVRGGYHGILCGDAKSAMAVMNIDNSHQGLYTQEGTGWIIYNNNATGLIGLGASTTTTGYKVTTNGSHRVTDTLSASSLSADSTISAGGLISGHHAVASYRSTATSTGYYKIAINSATAWMTAFTIRLYQSYVWSDIAISGYNYGSSYWYSPSAVMIGSSSANSMTVVFGHDGANKLWVAVPAANYTGLDIINVANGYTAFDSYKDLFTITHISSLSGTTQASQTIYRPWYRNERVSSSTTCEYPAGFASRTTGATWGNTTGTSFTCWNDSTGGSVDWRQDNPSAGKVSLKLDGRVYVNEGTNPVLSSEFANGYWGMCSPDGENNVWIRTTSNGIIPYQSGGNGSVGTSTWPFSSVYATTFYATSDARLKTNLRPYIPNKSILDLPIYKFDFINGTKDEIGCMAQDLLTICPEAVDTTDETCLSIKENKIIYLLLDEVKKLKAEIDSLKGGI